MLIRDADERDVAAIANLHAESWRTAYRGILADDYLDGAIYQERFAIWQERLSGRAIEGICVKVAEANDQVAGFVCVFPDEDSLLGSLLDNLHVAPPLTGRGIGRQLLSEIARCVVTSPTRTGLYFWILEQNWRPRRFYERTGAVPLGSADHRMPDGNRIPALRYHWPNPSTLIL
jgi:GNAT superfamily N-acetyltransferase